jgi:NADH-quinone oxidoreductase subunit K
VNEQALLQNYLLVGGLLFALGMIGFLVRRNMIVIFLCAEMMLQGVSISLVSWGRYHMDWGGQMLVLLVIAVAACEAAVALMLVLMLYRQSGSLDLTFWQDLRGEGLPAHVDRQIPEEEAADRVWPTLTPAGIEPEVDEEQGLFRPRV